MVEHYKRRKEPIEKFMRIIIASIFLLMVALFSISVYYWWKYEKAMEKVIWLESTYNTKEVLDVNECKIRNK